MGVYFSIRILVTSGTVITTSGLDLFSGAYLNGLSVAVVPSDREYLDLRGPLGTCFCAGRWKQSRLPKRAFFF